MSLCTLFLSGRHEKFSILVTLESLLRQALVGQVLVRQILVFNLKPTIRLNKFKLSIRVFFSNNIQQILTIFLINKNMFKVGIQNVRENSRIYTKNRNSNFSQNAIYGKAKLKNTNFLVSPTLFLNIHGKFFLPFTNF